MTKPELEQNCDSEMPNPVKLRATITVDYDAKGRIEGGEFELSIMKLRDVLIEEGYSNVMDEEGKPSITVDVRERRVPRSKKPVGAAKFRAKDLRQP